MGGIRFLPVFSSIGYGFSESALGFTIRRESPSSGGQSERDFFMFSHMGKEE